MKRTLSVILSISALCASLLPAQNTLNFGSLGKIVRFDKKAMDQILDKEAKIEVLGSGFAWAEGPVWIKDGGYLLFSDIPPNMVMKWKEGRGISTFLTPSGYTGPGIYGGEPGSNGLLLDAKGRLVSCEHGDRRVSVLTKGGGKRTLVDNYKGKRFNSPNDAVYHSNGDLYFTDPPYGLPKRWEDPRRELDFCGVYRLGKDGALTLLTKEMTRPNGIAFSPDEKTLYVAQSDPKAALWKAFPVKGDGTLGESRILADATSMVGKHKGLPDGLKVDRKGIIYATGPGGVHILAPDGKALGRIDTLEATANCGWGDDGSTLYITADMYLCRIKTKAKGLGF
ncbi:MAG: SMP-30/gluconolactonase/LRE family protein [Verrucomicrobiota bacterium]